MYIKIYASTCWNLKAQGQFNLMASPRLDRVRGSRCSGSFCLGARGTGGPRAQQKEIVLSLSLQSCLSFLYVSLNQYHHYDYLCIIKSKKWIHSI